MEIGQITGSLGQLDSRKKAAMLWKKLHLFNHQLWYCHAIFYKTLVTQCYVSFWKYFPYAPLFFCLLPQWNFYQRQDFALIFQLEFNELVNVALLGIAKASRNWVSSIKPACSTCPTIPGYPYLLASFCSCVVRGNNHVTSLCIILALEN